MAFWIFKLNATRRPPHDPRSDDPENYSWEQLKRDGGVAWDWVRESTSRKNLRSVQAGDQIVIYHTHLEKRVMGFAEVRRGWYQDNSSPPRDCVDIAPTHDVKGDIGADAIRQLGFKGPKQLNVIPLSKDEWDRFAGFRGQPLRQV